MSNVNSIYKILKDAGVEIANHASDLHVPVNALTRKLLKGYSATITTFISEIDGSMWFDIPFAYDPFFERPNFKL